MTMSYCQVVKTLNMKDPIALEVKESFYMRLVIKKELFPKQ